ncbi:MAG: DUF3971 domain-containing protein [Pseudomonadota bacterium]
MRRIISKSSKHLFVLWLEILAAVLAVVLMLWIGLLFRLNQGPIPLDFISRPLQQSINSGLEHYQISIGTTQLVWRGYSSPMELQLRTVEVHEKASGDPVLAVSGVGLGLSKRALLEGEVSPKSLSFYDTALRFYRMEDGQISLRMKSPEIADEDPIEQTSPPPAEQNQQAFWSEFMDQMLDQELTDQGEKSKLHYLDTIRILNADFMLQDEIRDQDFLLKDVHLVIKRSDRALIGTMEADLTLFESDTPVRTNFHYGAENGLTRVLTRFRELPFTEVSNFLPEDIIQKYRLDGAVGGVVFVLLDEAFNPVRMRLNATGYDGSLIAPDVFDTPLSFDQFSLKSTYAYETQLLTIENFEMKSGPARLSLMAQRRFDPDENLYRMDVSAGTSDLPIDRIDDYWPSSLAPPPRRWVTTNLSEGMVDSATLNLSATQSADTGITAKNILNIDDLSGEINFSAADVKYLPDFPKVKNVSGQARYTDADFTIETTGGVFEDIQVESSKIIIDGFKNRKPAIDISIDLESELTTALDLIDNEPFRLPSRMNLPVEDIKGAAAGRLHFSFPLKRDLTPADVNLSVNADLDNVSWKNIVLGQDIESGTLDLLIEKDSMNITGAAQMNGAPVDLDWTSYFDGAGPVKARLEAQTTLDRNVVLPFISQDELRLDGQFPTDIIYTRHTDGRQTAAVEADFKPAAFRIPRLDIEKPIGTEGRLVFTLDLQDDQLKTVRDIDFRSPSLAFQGTIGLVEKPGGGVQWQNAALSNLRFLKNRLNLSLTRKSGNEYALDIQGQVLDISSFLKAGRFGDQNKTQNAAPDGEKAIDRALLKISGTSDKLITSDRTPLTEAELFMIRDRQGLIDRLELDAMAGRGQVYIRYQPDDGGRHNLRIEADDAGAALRSFSLTNSIRGGTLIVDGQPIERGGLRDLQGRLQLSNFTVVEAPVLARLLNGLSLGGLQSLLSGEGLSFSRLKANFLWDENHDVSGRMTRKFIEIKNGATSGASLGLTFEGSIDLLSGQIDADGTLVPVSGLNKAVGDIPIIGDLLTGGGTGVFAATYNIQGPVRRPTVTVNPLAALAPGILRTIFFEGDYDAP